MAASERASQGGRESEAHRVAFGATSIPATQSRNRGSLGPEVTSRSRHAGSRRVKQRDGRIARWSIAKRGKSTRPRVTAFARLRAAAQDEWDALPLGPR